MTGAARRGRCGPPRQARACSGAVRSGLAAEPAVHGHAEVGDVPRRGGRPAPQPGLAVDGQDDAEEHPRVARLEVGQRRLLGVPRQTGRRPGFLESHDALVRADWLDSPSRPAARSRRPAARTPGPRRTLPRTAAPSRSCPPAGSPPAAARCLPAAPSRSPAASRRAGGVPSSALTCSKAAPDGRTRARRISFNEWHFAAGPLSPPRPRLMPRAALTQGQRRRRG